MASGLIYVLINPSFRNLLKIGETTRTSEERALEISVSTGVPTKFLVAYDQHTEDCDLAERTIHERLKQRRYGKDREFFELELKDALPVIAEVIESIDRDMRVKRSQEQNMKNTIPRRNRVEVVDRPNREVADKPNRWVRVRCQKCRRFFTGTVKQQGTIDCPHCKRKHYINGFKIT